MATRLRMPVSTGSSIDGGLGRHCCFKARGESYQPVSGGHNHPHCRSKLRLDAVGGRSSQHQWNEAVSCVTYEYWASKLKAEGDLQGAAAFKRAAGLSLKSLQRWQRPTGEFWVLKNRFDPALRHGYEGYTYYS